MFSLQSGMTAPQEPAAGQRTSRSTALASSATPDTWFEKRIHFYLNLGGPDGCPQVDVAVEITWFAQHNKLTP